MWLVSTGSICPDCSFTVGFFSRPKCGDRRQGVREFIIDTWSSLGIVDEKAWQAGWLAGLAIGSVEELR